MDIGRHTVFPEAVFPIHSRLYRLSGVDIGSEETQCSQKRSRQLTLYQPVTDVDIHLDETKFSRKQYPQLILYRLSNSASGRNHIIMVRSLSTGEEMNNSSWLLTVIIIDIIIDRFYIALFSSSVPPQAKTFLMPWETETATLHQGTNILVRSLSTSEEQKNSSRLVT